MQATPDRTTSTRRTIAAVVVGVALQCLALFCAGWSLLYLMASVWHDAFSRTADSNSYETLGVLLGLVAIATYVGSGIVVAKLTDDARALWILLIAPLTTITIMVLAGL